MIGKRDGEKLRRMAEAIGEITAADLPSLRQRLSEHVGELCVLLSRGADDAEIIAAAERLDGGALARWADALSEGAYVIDRLSLGGSVGSDESDDGEDEYGWS